MPPTNAVPRPGCRGAGDNGECEGGGTDPADADDGPSPQRPVREQRSQRIVDREVLLTGEGERRDPVGDQLELGAPRALMSTVEGLDSEVLRVARCHPASIEHLFALRKEKSTRHLVDQMRCQAAGSNRSG